MTTSRPWHGAEAALDSLGDAVISTDMARKITYLNPAAEALTGWPRSEATGRLLDDVFTLIDRQSRRNAPSPLDLATQTERTVGLAVNCLLVTRDGGEIEIEDSVAPMRDRRGNLTGTVIVFRDVSAARRKSREMAHLAHHDQLTGLPNRLLLDDRLKEAILLARRHGTALAVLFVDVDGFKDINDSRGHAAGDALLQSIAGRLTGSLRESDTVSRHSGDEFVILLSEVENAAGAAKVAEKLRRALIGPHRIGTAEINVVASVGVAVYPQDGGSGEALIESADAAMYLAKRVNPDRMRPPTSPPSTTAKTNGFPSRNDGTQTGAESARRSDVATPRRFPSLFAHYVRL